MSLKTVFLVIFGVVLMMVGLAVWLSMFGVSLFGLDISPWYLAAILGFVSIAMGWVILTGGKITLD